MSGYILKQIKKLPLEFVADRIHRLEIALNNIRDLARTGLPISSMTQEMYNEHRLNTIAGLASKALKQAERLDT